ncbi:hypothetical protein [Nonomuraea longicatena]|uniref:Integral membrane protein n=1 Tax=Nonomuraea longicatena TaxID=83682 RepID=A0ABN1NM39_9ACTN
MADIQPPAVPAGRPVIQGVVGGLSAALGFLALLASGLMSHYIAFGTALLLGGALVVWLAIVGRRIGWITWLATAAGAGAGLLLSLFVTRGSVGGAFGYSHGLGFPWSWRRGHIESEDWAVVEAARANPAMLSTRVDWTGLGLDLLFWWSVAVLVIVPIAQLRRVRKAEA